MNRNIKLKHGDPKLYHIEIVSSMLKTTTFNNDFYTEYVSKFNKLLHFVRGNCIIISYSLFYLDFIKSYYRFFL